ncbi:hypothetical protein GQX74_005587 [Glossina fuscipes]|nr:hypothetical protein GQX74_005587 [Glossina fuscipes]
MISVLFTYECILWYLSVQDTKGFMFADDTNIFYSFNSINGIAGLQSDLNSLFSCVWQMAEVGGCTLSSPEMAFIHALAAATVTSFIARACRDGQLASCGCSSGSRPKQLNDDWTWGGCGDNLEYAYK